MCGTPRTAQNTQYSTRIHNTHTQHAYTTHIHDHVHSIGFSCLFSPPLLLSLLSSSSLLNVLRRLDLRPRRIVPRIRTRIYVDHLSVSFVFKEEPGLVIGDHLEKVFFKWDLVVVGFNSVSGGGVGDGVGGWSGGWRGNPIDVEQDRMEYAQG